MSMFAKSGATSPGDIMAGLISLLPDRLSEAMEDVKAAYDEAVAAQNKLVDRVTILDEREAGLRERELALQEDKRAIDAREDELKALLAKTAALQNELDARNAETITGWQGMEAARVASTQKTAELDSRERNIASAERIAAGQASALDERAKALAASEAALEQRMSKLKAIVG